ncbi:MAG: MFS transporter, partial [Clostridia bacterium]
MVQHDKKSVISVYTVVALYWFSLYTYGSVLSNHATAMGADAVMVGLIVGSYGIAQMALRLPMGILSDVVKRRKLFIGAGLMISVASGIGLWLAQTPVQLLIFRTMAGMGVATSIVIPGYLTEAFPHEDGHRTMGNMSAAFEIGRSSALLAGGFIAQMLGVRWAFFLGGIAAALSMVPWFLMPSDTYHPEHRKHSIPELLKVIGDRDLLYSSIITIFFQFAVFASVFTFTPMLAKGIGINEAMIGVLTAVFTMTGIASAILSGTYLKRRFGPKRTVCAAFLASGLIFLITPHLETALLLFAFQIAAGFSMGMILPVMMAQSIRGVPGEKKGSAMGYFQS